MFGKTADVGYKRKTAGRSYKTSARRLARSFNTSVHGDGHRVKGLSLFLEKLSMVPTSLLFQRMLVLLGADTFTLGTTSGPTTCKLHLAKAAFTPSQDLTLADFVEADFDGYAEKSAVAGPMPQSADPTNADSLVDIPPGAAGYLWETSGVTNLPQTIFGYYLEGHGPLLMGCQLLPEPITLTGINQSIFVPRVGFRQLAGSVV
jgi:hypothetical protein